MTSIENPLYDPPAAGKPRNNSGHFVFQLPSKMPDMRRVPINAEPRGFGGTAPLGLPIVAPATTNPPPRSPTSLSYVMRKSHLLNDDTEEAMQGQVDYRPSRRVYKNMQEEGYAGASSAQRGDFLEKSLYLQGPRDVGRANRLGNQTYAETIDWTQGSPNYKVGVRGKGIHARRNGMSPKSTVDPGHLHTAGAPTTITTEALKVNELFRDRRKAVNRPSTKLRVFGDYHQGREDRPQRPAHLTDRQMREREKSEAARQTEHQKFKQRDEQFRQIQEGFGEPSSFGKGKWVDAVQAAKNADDISRGREGEERIERELAPGADPKADRKLGILKNYKFEPSSRDYCSPQPRIIDKRGGFVETDEIHANPVAGCRTADQTHVKRRLGKPFSPLAAVSMRSELSNDPRTLRTRAHMVGAIQSLEGENDTLAAKVGGWFRSLGGENDTLAAKGKDGLYYLPIDAGADGIPHGKIKAYGQPSTQYYRPDLRYETAPDKLDPDQRVSKTK